MPITNQSSQRIIGLDAFISHVKKQGMARTNRFQVVMPLPELIAKNYAPHAQMISLFAEQCQIPGVSFNTNPVRAFGESVEVPYEKMYEMISMSFYGDQDMIIKKMFDDWINLTQNTIRREYAYPNEYKVDSITISSMDPADNQRYVVKLVEAYPKTMTPITLDYNSREIMRVQVQFSYRYFTTETKRLPELSNNDIIMMN